VLVLFLLRAAHDVAAAEIGEVVCERAQRLDHVVDVGDVFLPLDLLAFPQRQLAQVDARHG
jgi:hypothetical protein